MLDHGEMDGSSSYDFFFLSKINLRLTALENWEEPHNLPNSCVVVLFQSDKLRIVSSHATSIECFIFPYQCLIDKEPAIFLLF